MRVLSRHKVSTPLFLALLVGISGTARAAVRLESFALESEYQNGSQEIRILLPDDYQRTKEYRVLYVLPVERGFESKFGDGLGELQKMDAHNRYDLIIVRMGFEKEPWYGDHPDNPKIRQASYLKEFVVPFVEGRYSTPGTREGRLLFGFSKSGWGAFSLIMRDPGFYGYAAAWDAPLMFERCHLGMERIFGTDSNLAAFRPDLLIRKNPGPFRGKNRLVLAGETLWGRLIKAPDGGSHTAGAHRLLEAMHIPHTYLDSLPEPHRWDESWMAPTLEALMELCSEKEGDSGR